MTVDKQVTQTQANINLPLEPIIGFIALGVIVSVTGGVETGAGVLELLDKAIKLICHVVMLAYEQRKIINSLGTGCNCAVDDGIFGHSDVTPHGNVAS